MLEAHRPFAIVLATDGARAPVLEPTLERARELTTPDRIFVVTGAGHTPLAGDVEQLVQPRDLGTGPALALPVLRVLARDPAARIVVLPAAEQTAALSSLDKALRAATHGAIADRIVMIGVPAEGPDPTRAWLVPGARIPHSAACEVDRFRDRPAPDEVGELWARGALWNTKIETGPVAAFWRLVSRCLPFHAAALQRYAAAIGTSRERAALHDAYRMMPPASFSHDVLAHARALAVLAIPRAIRTDIERRAAG